LVGTNRRTEALFIKLLTLHFYDTFRAGSGAKPAALATVKFDFEFLHLFSPLF